MNVLPSLIFSDPAVPGWPYLDSFLAMLGPQPPGNHLPSLKEPLCARFRPRVFCKQDRNLTSQWRGKRGSAALPLLWQPRDSPHPQQAMEEIGGGFADM